MKSTTFIPLMMVLAALLAGCEQEGPAERAGEQLDEATEDIGNEIEDACEELKDDMNAEDQDC